MVTLPPEIEEKRNLGSAPSLEGLKWCKFGDRSSRIGDKTSVVHRVDGRVNSRRRERETERERDRKNEAEREREGEGQREHRGVEEFVDAEHRVRERVLSNQPFFSAHHVTTIKKLWASRVSSEVNKEVKEEEEEAFKAAYATSPHP